MRALLRRWRAWRIARKKARIVELECFLEGLPLRRAVTIEMGNYANSQRYDSITQGSLNLLKKLDRTETEARRELGDLRQRVALLEKRQNPAA